MTAIRLNNIVFVVAAVSVVLLVAPAMAQSYEYQ